VGYEIEPRVVLCSGELYPCETDVRLCEELATGQEVEVDMENDVLTVLESGKQYNLKPLGEVRPPGHLLPYCPVRLW
jgi:3-isopropylmalate/(R)-2-methylmalate dehydratase small subunit